MRGRAVARAQVELMPAPLLAPVLVVAVADVVEQRMALALVLRIGLQILVWGWWHVRAVREDPQGTSPGQRTVHAASRKPPPPPPPPPPRTRAHAHACMHARPHAHLIGCGASGC